MPDTATPVTPFACEVHAKLTPGDVLLIITVCVLWPEQIVCGLGENCIETPGLTTTNAVSGGPKHPFASGVMMYEMVCRFWLLLDNTCCIELPVPLAAPVIDAGAVAIQLNVVPATVEVMEILVCADGQIVSGDGVALAMGTGLTVTT